MDAKQRFLTSYLTIFNNKNPVTFDLRMHLIIKEYLSQLER